jgi:hypothetical protein
MTKFEKVFSTAKPEITGGRGGDASRTDDEQSAIFRPVIKLAAGKKKVKVPADLAIDAEVKLGATGEAYGFATASRSACRVSSGKLPGRWSDPAEQPSGLR